MMRCGFGSVCQRSWFNHVAGSGMNCPSFSAHIRERFHRSKPARMASAMSSRPRLSHLSRHLSLSTFRGPSGHAAQKLSKGVWGIPEGEDEDEGVSLLLRFLCASRILSLSLDSRCSRRQVSVITPLRSSTSAAPVEWRSVTAACTSATEQRRERESCSQLPTSVPVSDSRIRQSASIQIPRVAGRQIESSGSFNQSPG